MFSNETAPCPDDLFRLGRYLGPCVDISPARMAKIVEENGQVLHKSMY